MAPDEARAEDVRAWLKKAALDLYTAHHLISAGELNLRADAVFHAQQAAEKALKGFLAWHDVPFRKTHNIAELGRACAALDGSLEATIDRAVVLTEYAWKFRYPGEPTEPSRDEAEQAITIAHGLFDALLSCLPDDVHP
ncbi:MAG TPA: HEPN domain-containing protein [Terriglobia bacterium]|nr:HEPN domain-containing protein [Terriglobia bacterium]